MMKNSNHKNKNKLVLSILLIAVLSFSSGAILVTASTSTPPWTLNYPLPANADWYVAQYSNTSYYGVSADGQSYYGPSTNASYIMNTVFAFGGRINIRGSFTITNTLYPATHDTYLDFYGSNITLNTGANCDMIGKNGVAYNRVTIAGGFWDMQGNLQSGGTAALNFGSVNQYVTIQDVNIIHPYGGGIRLCGTQCNLLHSSVLEKVYPCGDYANNIGVWLQTADSTIDGLWINTFGINVKIDSTSSSALNNLYLGGSTDDSLGPNVGQLLLKDCTEMIINNVRIDNSKNTALMINGGQNNQISNLHITSPAAVINPINCSWTSYNQLSNIWIGQKTPYPTDYGFNQPITEYMSSNNQYLGITATNCTSYTNTLNSGSNVTAYNHP